MGCDIHTRVEIFIIDKWTDADYYKRNHYDKLDEDDPEFFVIGVCEDRNYQRFAILANVRNNNGNTPICEPKGIPADCNQYIKKDYEGWGSDAHSASWFTLKELMDYQDTNPLVKYSGYISMDEAFKLDKHNELPTTWYLYTSDKTWVYREWSYNSEVLVPLIIELKKRLTEILYINEDRICEFSDKIRVVFWFDN